MSTPNNHAPNQPPPPHAVPAHAWKKLKPLLDGALPLYDKIQFDQLPETSWNPLRESRASCQRALDAILDHIVALLALDPADAIRSRIRRLQSDNAALQTDIALQREHRLLAPAQSTQNFVEGLLVASREACDDHIQDNLDAIAANQKQIELLKERFSARLEAIGVDAGSSATDILLLPVQDGVVAMAAVVTQVIHLTTMLQKLVEESREAPDQTRRYYGIYLLLVLAVDRVQEHFLEDLDQFQQRIQARQNQAAAAADEARKRIGCGGPPDTMKANVAANLNSIEACRRLAGLLRTQRRQIADANTRVRSMKADAVNTYRTVRISLDVGEMIGRCQAAFTAVSALELPHLRAFEGLYLSQEMQHLADAIAQPEK